MSQPRSLKARASWEKGKDRMISPAGHQAVFLEREKENGGEAGRKDTGDFSGWGGPRMLSMGSGRIRKAKKPRIQGQL